MDDVLAFVEEHIFSKYVYPEDFLPRDDIKRQTLSLFLISYFSGCVLYYGAALLDYHFIFDKNLMKHPKFLKNQIRKELYSASRSLPIMTAMTIPFFVAEVRGYTKLYDNFDDFGMPYFYLSLFCFMMWNDFLIYWIHRFLHSPFLYKHIHKEHHKWLVPTPFASHAFHPLDGWSQSLPYHLFVFIMPMHKWVFLVSFVLVNFWTISIHDGDYEVPRFFRSIINGAAHHTDHHLYFSYNYGQYFTLWDRIGGSFREPSPFLGNGPHDDLVKKGIVAKKVN